MGLVRNAHRELAGLPELLGRPQSRRLGSWGHREAQDPAGLPGSLLGDLVLLPPHLIRTLPYLPAGSCGQAAPARDRTTHGGRAGAHHMLTFCLQPLIESL